MTGKERIVNVLAGREADRLPVMPIAHSALAGLAGVPLGRYFTNADAMADVIVQGREQFGFDGVQLTLGVVAEPEALGARVDQPVEGGPLLKQHLLADPERLDDLRGRDITSAGRLPMYHAAVEQVVRRVGDDTFVLSTLRGPLNIASQLRGVEDMLIDMLQRPDLATRILEFTTELALQVSRASLAAGAHGLAFGEATCSPNFIAPAMYRTLVHPWHVRMIKALRAMGCPYAGLHVCGNITPIIDDLIATGADFIDVDYQVPAEQAIAKSAGRIALRGNLNPISLFLQGTEGQVRRETASLCEASAGSRWIASSGCDIPPGTSADKIAAFVETVAKSGSH